MATTHILGFTRIGGQRELKFALEAFWRGGIDEAELTACGVALRARHWQMQADAGMDLVTVGDFAWYDQVLNMLALLGATPARFNRTGAAITLTDYFRMARGDADQFAMEMTKWFDTNYHYMVPEWSAETRFDGGIDWLFDEVAEARAGGHRVKVVLIGPLTLLHLGKIKSGLDHSLALLPAAIRGYHRILKCLKMAGVEWVQMDEPILAGDLDANWLRAFETTYASLSAEAPPILLATYFDDVNFHAELFKRLPVSGIHLDLVRAPEQAAAMLADWPPERILSAGVVDGRNIWRNDLDQSLDLLRPLHSALGERLWIGSSCSLMHVPVDLTNEVRLDAERKSWLAFAVQKLDEIQCLKLALTMDRPAIGTAFAASRAARHSRLHSPQIHNRLVQQRMATVEPSHGNRLSPFAVRKVCQQQKWQLPLFPTTTIGSFPQTAAIRQTRAAWKRGDITHLAYLEHMREEIRHAVAQQESLGLDVLVHGEAERNDMVEYFGEQLWGYAFTEQGWVQSYGSRCVKPPFIYGDVYRPEPMTVGWSRFAQSLTEKPMKGMLSGPVTMLQWSFVRDDQPRATTALQIALALRDEVHDLEQAGIGMIQIDEPALREGLPLKARDWPQYLEWAVKAFRISAGGVADQTQIHTHMCYAELNDILPWIAAMDADVITIETSRSDMTLLDAFGAFDYPNDIGPGVYDIHAPRIPKVEEITRLLHKARGVIPDRRLWVNPDCGLKTRSWPETLAALRHMVQAAQALRKEAAILHNSPEQAGHAEYSPSTVIAPPA